MKGYVYVISNKAMPGLYKIGYSDRDPSNRAIELNSTGVPHPYVVDYEILVDSPYIVEQNVHKFLECYNEGKEWFRCELGKCIDAIRKNTSHIYYENLYTKIGDDEKDKFIALQKQAEAGIVNAQFELGEIYYYGSLGIAVDIKMAIKWYHKAADLGYIRAFFMLGEIFASVDVKNYSEAAKWYRKAAEQGHPLSQQHLADIYYYGLGVPQDYKEARKWYIKSAQHPDLCESLFMLGTMYEEGLGVEQNYAEAIKFYNKAAENDTCIDSYCPKYRLGLMYKEGRGVPQDFVKAAELFRNSSNDYAVYQLGYLYLKGLGVSKNYTEAEKLIRKAAKCGINEAVCTLGFMYLYGYGVPINYIEAEKLLRLAESRGYQKAEYILAGMYTAGLLTPKNSSEAEKWLQLLRTKPKFATIIP